MCLYFTNSLIIHGRCNRSIVVAKTTVCFISCKYKNLIIIMDFSLSTSATRVADRVPGDFDGSSAQNATRWSFFVVANDFRRAREI